MRITIKGNAKEVAALVLLLQGQRDHEYIFSQDIKESVRQATQTLNSSESRRNEDGTMTAY